MKILITGANGFLGSHLLRRLKSKGKNVSALIHQNQDNIPTDTPLYNYESIQKCSIDFDVIFHLGAFIPALPTNDSQSSTNVETTRKLISLYPNTHWIYSSSVSVYENCIELISESTAANFTSEYAKSKFQTEELVTKLNQFKIIRFSSLYGTGMRPNSIIPRYIAQSLQGNVISVYGEGERLQDYLYIEDALDYLESLLDAPNGIYLGVNGTPVSNKSLAHITARLFGSNIDFLKHKNEGTSYTYNNHKTKSILKINKLVSIEEGIAEMNKNQSA
ncbi:NAD(P)-dependent oxidoreductase [Reichenbachiella sp. MSK19-1]|uniref:NAD-dependent epimerase/dehydratase family protein n=1 Tax=Reichenbachiella sp. MSK19-1 TaxID=1897631 RepID=UPI0011C48569|nr:NAD(P)-dependent oxidoreductase [Reichenbachiella sp. MSK19-1]